jgi:hypothetical protein
MGQIQRNGTIFFSFSKDRYLIYVCTVAFSCPQKATMPLRTKFQRQGAGKGKKALTSHTALRFSQAESALPFVFLVRSQGFQLYPG